MRKTQTEREEALKQYLLEIGVAASEALALEHITEWAEGGRLGDALIGIKDIVDTALQDEKVHRQVTPA